MRACGSEAEEHMCACRVRGHTCVCVCCVRSAGKVSGGRRAVRPVPHTGPALRSAGRTLAGVWRGRPCARGDAGRLAGRVAVRVVPRGLVLGREGACVGVRRVPSGARGGVAAEQVARGRAVVFFFWWKWRFLSYNPLYPICGIFTYSIQNTGNTPSEDSAESVCRRGIFTDSATFGDSERRILMAPTQSIS